MASGRSLGLKASRSSRGTGIPIELVITESSLKCITANKNVFQCKPIHLNWFEVSVTLYCSFCTHEFSPLAEPELEKKFIRFSFCSQVRY